MINNDAQTIKFKETKTQRETPPVIARRISIEGTAYALIMAVLPEEPEIVPATLPVAEHAMPIIPLQPDVVSVEDPLVTERRKQVYDQYDAAA